MLEKTIALYAPVALQHQLGVLFPVYWHMLPAHVHYQVRPDGLDLSLTQAALTAHKGLGAAPALPQHGQGVAHALAARADHAQGGGAVAQQRRGLHEVGDELLAAAPEPQVREAVLVGDDVVGHAAEAEDERDEDAGAVLARRAVDEQRGGRGGGEVPQDGGEGLCARGGGAGLEDVLVDTDEALRLWGVFGWSVVWLGIVFFSFSFWCCDRANKRGVGWLGG